MFKTLLFKQTKKTQIFIFMERKETQYKTEVEKFYKYIQEPLISSD